MSEVKWIKIATTIFDDEKIMLIESMPDADALIVIWLKLLVLAGKSNSNGVLMMSNKLPYTEEMLASIFRRQLNTVRLALTTFERFGMIEYVNDVITIPNWEKHQNIEGLDKIREQTRKRVARYREKQKLLANVTLQVTCSNEAEQDKEKELDKELESCSYTDIWKKITVEEIDNLHDIYENADDLIQAVYEEVRDKHKVIDNVYAYIVGYANNKGWCRIDRI